MRSSLRLAIAAGMIFNVACTTFQPVALEEITRAGQGPGPFRLTTADGRKVKVVYPAVRADSILGLAPDRRSGIRLHKDDVRKVEAKKISGRNTGLAVAGTVLLGGPLIWLMLIMTSGGITL